LPKGDFVTLNSDKIIFNYPKDWVRSEINGSSTVLIIRHDDDLITVRKEVGEVLGYTLVYLFQVKNIFYQDE
jgi:hypothetical protein